MTRLLLAFILFFSSQTIASRLPVNCTVSVVNFRQDGNIEKVTFKTHLQNKKECATLAGFHRPNFEKDRVKLKRVNFRWHENRHLAKRPRR